MTTKPKAKRFRIRRNNPAGGTGAAEAAPQKDIPAERFAGGPSQPTPPQQSPKPQQAAPTAQVQPRQQHAAPGQGAPTSATMTAEQEIDAIKREGLTGRQLRMARRLAQKHGVAATSDYDAIRLLRAQGIDPFQRESMLELVVPEGAGRNKAKGAGAVQLPQTISLDKTQLPSTETRSPAERRAHEIQKIQRDIGKRRRRKLALLLTRLAAFVFLPTLLAGWYYYVIATPMYATKSEFLILQADGGGGGGIGGLLSGTQFATSQDSIATQSYLMSKDAMIRLDKDVGFKRYFSDPRVDPLQRLDPQPSNEQAHKLYKKYVTVGYDPTEGVIRMEVSSPDPLLSESMSTALISYAEERVDDLSRRKREDQMSAARQELELAKTERRKTQNELVNLQNSTLLDPEGVIASLRSQINTVEVKLLEKELFLQALLDNNNPNQARVEGARGDIRRLSAQQQQLQDRMRDAAEGEVSLAQQTVQIQMAQADLVTADVFLQNALQAVKQSELEASKQVRYLTTSVRPVASQDPSYPRSFENTALAFVIFSGIYLMISLTASILREQVSS